MPCPQWPPSTYFRQLNLSFASFASVTSNWDIWHVWAVSSTPESGTAGTRLNSLCNQLPNPVGQGAPFCFAERNLGARCAGGRAHREVREIWWARTTHKDEHYFPHRLCGTKKSRQRESLTADLLPQSHAGVSENTKTSTDRLTLVLMLELKVIFAINCCSRHYLSWCSLGL